MTEASVTVEEDEENWQLLDDLEGFEFEDDDIPIDPALLRPQVNLVKARRSEDANYISRPLRLDRQLYNIPLALAIFEQKLKNF